MRGVIDMPKRLVKHGNSRAVVIDKAILELLKIDDETELELSTDGSSLMLTPVGAREERRARIDEALLRVDARYSTTLDRLAK